MKRNLFFIVCTALIAVVILIPLKAHAVHYNEGRLEEEDTEECNYVCGGGGAGTSHVRGTGNNNASCDPCGSPIWDVCVNYLNTSKICVEKDYHTQSPCPSYDPAGCDQLYNQDAKEG